MEARRRTRLVVAVVAACCAATWVVKSLVLADRVHPGHGDISGYFNVARSLVDGRGFEVDTIGGFWGHPTGLPTPSNLWWMPLVSIVAAVGMALGERDYASAQAATIAVSSLLPWIVYLLGRDLFDRRTGLLAALLSTTHFLFLGQPSTPNSAATYVLVVPLTLWLALHVARRPRWMLAAGACLALAHLSRTDGLLLVGALVTGLLSDRAHRPDRAGWLAAGRRLALGYGLVMAPWWARNLATFGTPQPSVSGRALFMTEYRQWTARPESVTLERWLAQGWDTILARKLEVGLANLQAFGVGLAKDVGERPWTASLWAVVGLAVLTWPGMLACLRRRCAPLWVHVVLVWAFYSLAFTIVGRGSFRSALYGLYPFQLVCAAWTLIWLPRQLLRLSRVRWVGPLAAGLTVVASAGVLVGQHAHAVERTVEKVAWIERSVLYHQALEHKLLRPLGLGDEALLMTADVHEFNALLERPAVQLPSEDGPVILDMARQLGVTHVLLTDDREWRRGRMRVFQRQQGVRLVYGPRPFDQRVVRLYEVLPAEAAGSEGDPLGEHAEDGRGPPR